MLTVAIASIFEGRSALVNKGNVIGKDDAASVVVGRKVFTEVESRQIYTICTKYEGRSDVRYEEASIRPKRTAVLFIY